MVRWHGHGDVSATQLLLTGPDAARAKMDKDPDEVLAASVSDLAPGLEP